MANPELELEIILDDGSVKKAFANVERSAKSTSEKTKKSFTSSFSGINTAILGIGASLLTAFAGKQLIDAAKVQQQAVEDFNTSLRLSGKFSKEASLGFQEYASQLQANSVVGDEVILKNAALIQNLGKLENDALKGATQAALDMSAALGISLASASTLVGKAAAGEISSFTRYGVVIEKGATNAETFANALTRLNDSFGGAAAAKVNTYQGASEQLSNTYGDLLESAGDFVVQNPLVVEAFKLASKEISNLITSVKGFLGNGGINEINNELIRTAFVINDNVIIPFQKLLDVGDFVFSSLVSGVQTIINGFTALGSVTADLLNLAGVENDFTRALQRMHKTTNELTIEMANDAANAFNNIFENESTGMEVYLNKIAQKQREIIANNSLITPETQNIEQEAPDIASNEDANFFDSFKEGFTDFGPMIKDSEKQLEAFESKIQAFGKKTKDSLLNGFASSAANAFSGFGAALVNGENALGAFADALFQSIAQQAVALGTSFMLQGAAMLFSPNPKDNASAPGLIAGGAALATFGGALGAIAGGSTSSASSAATNPTNPYQTDTVTDSSLVEEESEQAEPQTVVNFNFSGDYLDTEDSRLRIASLMQQAVNEDNITIGGIA
ncbi:MAG: hypothetical protein CME63_01570 [Halobacteriovoraceae bacterium]|nr:hypothetical protein [Halobacteriovoraceae bacterium]|tara:strand:+ start:35592 stop:37448 length:1857 start_codon:yes stop_codon:yes gene_type:complete